MRRAGLAESCLPAVTLTHNRKGRETHFVIPQGTNLLPFPHTRKMPRTIVKVEQTNALAKRKRSKPEAAAGPVVGVKTETADVWVRRSTRRQEVRETPVVAGVSVKKENGPVDVGSNTPGRGAQKRKGISPESKKKKKMKVESKVRVKKEKNKEGPPTSWIAPGRDLELEFYLATKSLAQLHPHVIHTNEERRKTLLESSGTRVSVTDSIVATMLSQVC
jgi:hypothetical protein